MYAVTLDLGVLWLNLSLVLCAGVANVAAYRWGNPRYRWLWSMNAILCGIFAISYLWLLTDYPHRILTWSKVMRGVSIVAWINVWILPTVLSIFNWRKRVVAASALEAKVAELGGNGE